MTANMDLERIKATTTSLPLYPEFDSPKLFVSHIPTHLTTNDLKQIFSEFGTIYELQLLFHTDQTSKGCCFVRFHTFDAAQRAQTALHDQRFLPPSKYPLQIKLADFSLDRRDRKLFVGMLSHSLVEEDLAHIFDRFGHIEDCTVLRDSDGKSRGCAFITFATKESANEAIDTVHRSMRMEGCSSPINVKLAEGGGEERKGSLSERGMQNRRISLQCEKKSRWSDETRKYFSPTRLSFDAESVGQRQLVGPKDSNVFVYNLPVTFNEDDLFKLFKDFGSVISVKIFIDKRTGLSKCFGFVSFQNPRAALSAINGINGREIQKKKLKVQLKNENNFMSLKEKLKT